MADTRRWTARGVGVSFVAWAMVLAALPGCRGGGGGGGGGDPARSRRGVGLVESDRAQADQIADLSRSPEQIAALRERAIQELVLGAECPVAEGRAHAAEAMLAIPSRFDGVADQLLRDQNLGVRSIAAFVVGKAKLSGHEARLREMLSDPSPFVRASALFALDQTGANVNPTPLAGMLLGQPDLRLRSHVAFLLGEMGEPSAKSPLREARALAPERASPEQLRLYYLQIAEALVKLGDDRAIFGIRGALYPGRPEEFEATALAVQIIGELGDRGSLDALIYLTASKDRDGNLQPEEIRLAAAATACRLGETSGAFIADENWRSGNPELRSQSAEVYGWTYELERLPRLERMLGDSSVRVRLAAAEAILRITEANRGALLGARRGG